MKKIVLLFAMITISCSALAGVGSSYYSFTIVNKSNAPIYFYPRAATNFSPSLSQTTQCPVDRTFIQDGFIALQTNQSTIIKLACSNNLNCPTTPRTYALGIFSGKKKKPFVTITASCATDSDGIIAWNLNANNNLATVNEKKATVDID